MDTYSLCLRVILFFVEVAECTVVVLRTLTPLNPGCVVAGVAFNDTELVDFDRTSFCSGVTVVIFLAIGRFPTAVKLSSAIPLLIPLAEILLR